VDEGVGPFQGSQRKGDHVGAAEAVERDFLVGARLGQLMEDDGHVKRAGDARRRLTVGKGSDLQKEGVDVFAAQSLDDAFEGGGVGDGRVRTDDGVVRANQFPDMAQVAVCRVDVKPGYG